MQKAFNAKTWRGFGRNPSHSLSSTPSGGAATAAMAGEEARFAGRPLSLTLSPLVPRREREKRPRKNLRGARRSRGIALQRGEGAKGLIVFAGGFWNHALVYPGGWLSGLDFSSPSFASWLLCALALNFCCTDSVQSPLALDHITHPSVEIAVVKPGQLNQSFCDEHRRCHTEEKNFARQP